jgi:hypothetical protein
MNVGVEPATEPTRLTGGRLLVGVAVPLAIVALAYALWWISDRLVSIGPFDRAAFGWGVVIPVWLAAPIVAGFIWSRLPGVEVRLAAVAVGTVVSTAAVMLFWQGVANPDCEFGSTRTAGQWVGSSVFVGGVIGVGVVVSALLASRLARGGHPWRALAIGAVTDFAMIFVAIFVAASVSSFPCQRPSL